MFLLSPFNVLVNKSARFVSPSSFPATIILAATASCQPHAGNEPVLLFWRRLIRHGSRQVTCLGYGCPCCRTRPFGTAPGVHLGYFASSIKLLRVFRNFRQTQDVQTNAETNKLRIQCASGALFVLTNCYGV